MEKDFKGFKNNLEIIGNIKIVANLDNNGNGSVNAGSWEYLNGISAESKEKIVYRGQTVYHIKAVIKQD
ncbi:hypothetical protein ACFQZS_19190 [Mucilaginibacter calamicampi]|uniref:Uncharacterized protein n=1 Tax=Mucilaginibacter calamicampi TaxID=1302352 RepID=A0ABW2Z0P6_9SPHI